MTTPWTITTATDGVQVLAREYTDLLGAHHEEVVAHGQHTHPAAAAAMRAGVSQRDLGAIVAHAYHDGGQSWWQIHWADGAGSSMVQRAGIAGIIERKGCSAIEPSAWAEVAWRDHQRRMAAQ